MSETATLPPMLTVADIMEVYGVSGTTAREWCKTGKLEGARRVAYRWLIPPAALETFERRGPGRPTKEEEDE